MKAGPGYCLAVAMSVEREGAAALVPDQVAAAAPHQTAATGDGDLNEDPLLAQTCDLGILLCSGHEKNDGGSGESCEADDYRNSTNTAGIHVHTCAAKLRDWPLGRTDLTGCHLVFTRIGPSKAGRVDATIRYVLAGPTDSIFSNDLKIVAASLS